MVLKQDRPLGSMRPVMGKARICHRAEQGRVVVDEDAVVKHGRVGGRLDRTIVLEPGRREDDVVGLPLAGLA